MSFKIFTIQDGKVEEGALVESFTIRNGTKIPAILVGQNEKYMLGVLPVQGGTPGEKIFAAKVGTSRSGRPKLIADSATPSDEKAIVVMRTTSGYRGNGVQAGDVKEVYWCDTWRRIRRKHEDFPGEILVRGHTSRSPRGALGTSTQIVAVIPKDKVFSEIRSGRLYGAPGAMYYAFDGEKMQVATWEERKVAFDMDVEGVLFENPWLGKVFEEEE